MVDRTNLLKLCVEQVKFNSADAVKFNNTLSRALAIALPAISLERAQAICEHDGGDLIASLKTLLTIPELKKVAKAWEPKRTIAATETQTEIATALIELLEGSRAPYEKPSLTLKAAHALSREQHEALRHLIAHRAPLAHLRSLATKWDKHGPSMKSEELGTVRKHLLALLDAQSAPTSAPAKKSKAA
ncbi:MAG: hypothetical protein MRY63_13370 [Neomegalonema sp.]|nr:hypothetical protein [Neomegalonema sp.]